ncbi:MAG: hypothetical protein ACR2PL_15740, partial [Dehalococcoidia bacterium]
MTLRVNGGATIPRLPGAEAEGPIGIGITVSGSVVQTTLENNTTVQLDVTQTAVIDLAPGVAVASVQVSMGTTTVQGSQIVWSNFSLASAQQATATISLVATGGGAVVASAATIRSVSVEAIDTRTGERFSEQALPGAAALAAAAPAATPAAVAASPATGGAAVAAAAAAAPAVQPASSAGGVPPTAPAPTNAF